MGPCPAAPVYQPEINKRIREDVTFLMQNLGKTYGYTQQGAKEVCIYVIDNDLARKFASPAKAEE